MPEELKNEKIVVNLGNGSYSGEEGYTKNGYVIINTINSICKAVQKKEGLKTFIEKGIPTLDVVDLCTVEGRTKAKELLKEGKALCYKPRHEVAVIVKTEKDLDYWIANDASYMTVYIDKKEQYRVNIVCGCIFEVKKYKIDEEAENPDEGGMKNNCAWVEKCRLGAAYPKDVGKLALRAAECIGLGLTGVDILRDEKGVARIIEVNSAPILDTTDVKIFYRTLMAIKKNLVKKPKKIKNKTVKATIKKKKKSKKRAMAYWKGQAKKRGVLMFTPEEKRTWECSGCGELFGAPHKLVLLGKKPTCPKCGVKKDVLLISNDGEI